MKPRTRLLLWVGSTLLAIACGVWWGVHYSQSQIAERLAARDASYLQKTTDRRKELLGRWIEEKPMGHGSVPLIGRSRLDLNADGTYAESVWLLSPERDPLKGMHWTTVGIWKVHSSKVEFQPRRSTGPTTRPLDAWECSAYAGDTEMSLYSFGGNERGDTFHKYRRLLADTITEDDVDAAIEQAIRERAKETTDE